MKSIATRSTLTRTTCHEINSQFCFLVILLLAGDVKQNPVPVRYPCTVCKKPVCCYQREIECTWCVNWGHATCCGVSVDEYRRVGENANKLWYSPECLARELLLVDDSFRNVSRNAWDGDDLQQLLKLMKYSGECTKVTYAAI